MKDRKLPVIFLSLFFAFLVWASINLGNQFTTYIELPIHISNIRPTQAIAVPLPKSVKVKIQSTGWQLLSTILSPNLSYAIDFRSFSKLDTLFTLQDFSSHVDMPISIRIYEATPETILIRLDEKTTKKVPIVPDIKVSFRNGFDMVGPVNVTPDSVRITGASMLLNKIRSWSTKKITLSDINTPANVSISLVDSLDFEIFREGNDASVVFDVQPIAERNIDDIPVEIVQVPENRNVVLIPPTISIIIRSGVNVVSPLTTNDFHAYIEYKEILLDTSGMVKPNIIGPDNIKIVRQIPEQMQYVIRK